MSASQFRLLTLFVERAGELVTRDDVAARLWTDTRNIDVATGINTAINRLRRHLQEAPGAPSSIETVIGLGYRFIATMERVERSPGTEEKPLGTPSAPEPVLLSEIPFPAPGEPQVPDGGSAPSRETGDEPKIVATWRPPEVGRPRPIAPRQPWRVATLVLCILVALLSLVALSLLKRSRGLSAQTSAADGQSTQPPFTRVTADEQVGRLTAAAVAPDGQSVAYANRFGVSVHWFASGTERLLGVRPSFRVDRLSWFPSGNRLLMSGLDTVLGHQQVWLVPLQGAYLTPLADDANRATVSPEGGQIAFTRNEDRELWLADADGQHQRPLRRANAGESFDVLIWSPAGNRLITTLQKGPGSDSAGTTAVTKSPGFGAYECIDAASGQVLTREEGFSAASGYLLADGRFYFVTNETPGPTTGEADLMSVPTDPVTGRFRSTPRLVRRFGARHAQSLTASFSGERFAAVLDRAEIDVHVADIRQPGLELSNVRRLTQGARQNFPHSWTADGRGVIFERDASTKQGAAAKWAIYGETLDNEAKPSLIASLPESAAMAQLSPDGRWILFLEFTGYPQHASGIFRIPSAGGKVEQVTTHGSIEEFHCSASSAGRCVLREAIGNEALVYYTLDPVEGMGQELGRTEWQPNRLGDWNLSADGTTVAAAGHDEENPVIQLIRLGTVPGHIHTIAVPGHGTMLGANWAVNGRFLFVETKTQTGFELLSLDLDGHVRLLRQSPTLIWAVPSRNGEKVAFPSLNLSESLWTSTAQ